MITIFTDIIFLIFLFNLNSINHSFESWFWVYRLKLSAEIITAVYHGFHLSDNNTDNIILQVPKVKFPLQVKKIWYYKDFYFETRTINICLICCKIGLYSLYNVYNVYHLIAFFTFKI